MRKTRDKAKCLQAARLFKEVTYRVMQKQLYHSQSKNNRKLKIEKNSGFQRN